MFQNVNFIISLIIFVILIDDILLILSDPKYTIQQLWYFLSII